MFKFFRDYTRARIFHFRLAHARREADRRRAISGLKQFILCISGRPHVVSKQHIKQLIRDGHFAHGVKAADVEARAIYVTH